MKMYSAKDLKALFKRNVEKWGTRSQLEMAQEEATELALACRKFIRKQNDEQFDNLTEEIADVELMIAQLKSMFPKIKGEVKKWKLFKLNRLEERLNNDTYES